VVDKGEELLNSIVLNLLFHYVKKFILFEVSSEKNKGREVGSQSKTPFMS